MIKHTATPWKMQPGARPYFNCGEDGCSFGPITYAGSMSQMIADAEFAVRAANSHDEMLAAATALLGGPMHGEETGASGSTTIPVTWEAIKNLRAAIAKAKGA